MAQLEYGKLGRYLKTEHLNKINIEDFLPQYVITELNKALNMGDFDSIKMEIPNMHVEFEGYIDTESETLATSRLAFVCDAGYVVIKYVASGLYKGARPNETTVSIYRNQNFFEPSTDFVSITDNDVVRCRGNQIVIKEQERGK